MLWILINCSGYHFISEYTECLEFWYKMFMKVSPSPDITPCPLSRRRERSGILSWPGNCLIFMIASLQSWSACRFSLILCDAFTSVVWPRQDFHPKIAGLRLLQFYGPPKRLYAAEASVCGNLLPFQITEKDNSIFRNYVNKFLYLNILYDKSEYFQIL